MRSSATEPASSNKGIALKKDEIASVEPADTKSPHSLIIVSVVILAFAVLLGARRKKK